MTMVRRPGRVQKIAYDDTPPNSRTPNIDARIGWLLAMSRLHHPDPEMADGRRFVQALAEAGCVASRSLVSRWESGEIPISYEGMTGYERALGLETGRISSLTGYMRAAMPGVRARVARPQLDPASREFSIRLDELIELAEDGHARAVDWQELGWHLAVVPLVHLRARTWEAITHRVINQLPRSVKVPYRQYSTAALNIASVQRAQDFLTDAVGDCRASHQRSGDCPRTARGRLVRCGRHGSGADSRPAAAAQGTGSAGRGNRTLRRLRPGLLRCPVPFSAGRVSL
jgi:hypothetical protein